MSIESLRVSCVVCRRMFTQESRNRWRLCSDGCEQEFEARTEDVEARDEEIGAISRRSAFWYALDANHRPIPTTIETAMMADRAVANDEVGDVRISTVFLMFDHGWGNGPPLLFETMIFGGEHDQFQERCSTWDQAEAMHARAVTLVMRGADAPANDETTGLLKVRHTRIIRLED